MKRNNFENALSDFREKTIMPLFHVTIMLTTEKLRVLLDFLYSSI